MNYNLEQIAQVHLNVMEILVQQEIEKQLKFYPSNIKAYLNRIEIATYALNRLPALYASSETGKEQQLKVGQQKYKSEIVAAVRRALAAVERDPLRKSTPLVSTVDAQYKLAKTALEKLEKLLYRHHLLSPNQSLTWNDLAYVIQQALSKIALRKNQHQVNNLATHSSLKSQQSSSYTSGSIDDSLNCTFHRLKQ
ncbi:hypothetical protein PCC8801_3552 [Rippkaea orientalis PCC 8801]|uniref:Late competence development protein ComFB n=1 Tax=Rippkaea orientalis (strain PCC 8801 / RF-1) TaxID=41431 RepID=B7K1H4_RIPO1|nr:late competence development ComFB family protein [Rippkaea orientalis]ACK67516.1 hypothetical protein PCC8801_3552 [Rippkaea orientalis PCC 8801]